jgi:hypothetical protein
MILKIDRDKPDLLLARGGNGISCEYSCMDAGWRTGGESKFWEAARHGVRPFVNVGESVG